MKHTRVLTVTLLACVAVAEMWAQEAPPALVWPGPPQEPRIRFLQHISGPADIGVERSFLRKIFDWVIGTDDDASSAMVKPLGVTVDRGGQLYVTDPGAGCVHIFDRANKEYSRLTTSGEDQLRSPVGVAVADDGTIYVTDSERREVVVYDADGDERQVIRGVFQRPTGVVIHNGKLYVVDTLANRVLVFDLQGKFLFDFGRRGAGEGEFNFPVFLASSDRLVLVDAMNFRVQTLGDSGRALGSFGKAGDVQGTFANPKGIAVDRDGRIYVADALFDAFQIFDSTGALLLVVGASGKGDGEFSIPEGVCLDGENRVYIVDSLNRRVQMFQVIRNSER
jgi:DNA-binding beta-propeller fold protein YncE